MNIRSAAKGETSERKKGKGFHLSASWRKEEGIFSPKEDEICFIRSEGRLKGTGSVLFSGK